MTRTVTNVELQDITRDPRFDPHVCVNCGGLIGCEFCPKGYAVDAADAIWSPVPFLSNVDPGDENDYHERKIA